MKNWTASMVFGLFVCNFAILQCGAGEGPYSFHSIAKQLNPRSVSTPEDAEKGYWAIDFPNASTNDNGFVAFSGVNASFSSGLTSGIYSGPDPVRDALIDTSDNGSPAGFNFTRLGPADVNDSGAIVFAGVDGDDNAGIWTITDGEVNLIADKSHYWKFTVIGDANPRPRINDSGDVAFFAKLLSEVEDGLFKSSSSNDAWVLGRDVNGLADPDEHFSFGFDLNADGVFAFATNSELGNYSVLRGQDGNFEVLASGRCSLVPHEPVCLGDGPFDHVFPSPRVNAVGDIVFSGTGRSHERIIQVNKANGDMDRIVFDLDAEETIVEPGLPVLIDDEANIYFSGILAGQDKQGIYGRTADGDLHAILESDDQLFSQTLSHAFPVDVSGNGRILFGFVEEGDSPVHLALATPIKILADVDGDSNLDATDIDLLSQAIRANDLNTRRFDFTSDQVVNDQDRLMLVQSAFATRLGDADLDRDVDFADFLVVSENFGTMGGWREGDFSGDGLVDFEDFLQMSTNFGFETTTSSVPEPYGLTLAILAVGLLCTRHRRVFAPQNSDLIQPSPAIRTPLRGQRCCD